VGGNPSHNGHQTGMSILSYKLLIVCKKCKWIQYLHKILFYFIKKKMNKFTTVVYIKHKKHFRTFFFIKKRYLLIWWI
jgi:hypothetical protein